MKPLGIKNYGSIPHLSFSRLGPGDHYCAPGQEKIATESFTVKSRGYRVIVQIKLDGSNVGVARIQGELVPLVRKGYTALSSSFEMHHLFHDWAMANQDRFAFLKEGERVAGEWLAQAHGIRYKLMHDPFVAFDLFTAKNQRYPFHAFDETVRGWLERPYLLHNMCFPFGRDQLTAALETYDRGPHHGELEPCEGAIYRVESGGRVLYLCKYVRPEKVDGKYLNAGQEIWNWRPAAGVSA